MTTTPRFELYSYWRTAATYRVRVALAFKGLAGDEHNVNLDAGEQRSEAFLENQSARRDPSVDRSRSASRARSRSRWRSSNISTKCRLLPLCSRGRRRAAPACAPSPSISPQTPTRSSRGASRSISSPRAIRRRKFRAWQIQLVDDRTAGGREAPGERNRNRHLLSRRYDHKRRHLPGKPLGRDPDLQNRRRRTFRLFAASWSRSCNRTRLRRPSPCVRRGRQHYNVIPAPKMRDRAFLGQGRDPRQASKRVILAERQNRARTHPVPA